MIIRISMKKLLLHVICIMMSSTYSFLPQSRLFLRIWNFATMGDFDASMKKQWKDKKVF
jgi:hypothetical protein